MKKLVTLYWYPKCSTCRDAKKWLESQGQVVETIDMIQEVPSPELLAQWVQESDLPIRRFFNTSGVKYRALGLKDKIDGYTLEEACQLLATDGMLIKRPILVKDGHFLVNGFKEKEYGGVL